MDDIKKENKGQAGKQPIEEAPREGRSMDQRVLDEQHLSAERQREGKAWQGLEVDETHAKRIPETRDVERETQRKPPERPNPEP